MVYPSVRQGLGAKGYRYSRGPAKAAQIWAIRITRKTQNWQCSRSLCIVPNVSKYGDKPAVVAWQPFTFGGVAAFARSGWLRLFGAQIIVAAIVSGSVVWFLWRNYSPIITQGLEKMPPRAMVSGGRLQGISNAQISENRFLAIAVAPGPAVDFGQSADLQIELRKSNLRLSSIFRSLLGSFEFAYGPDEKLDLGPENLAPWWGAWRPVFLAGAGVGTGLLLLALWAGLASLYAAPAKFIAWLMDRKLSWGDAWRLGSAALMPGALLLSVSVVLYGWRVLDLVGFVSLVCAHFLTGWMYVAFSPGFAPRLFPAATQNPFTLPPRT